MAAKFGIHVQNLGGAGGQRHGAADGRQIHDAVPDTPEVLVGVRARQMIATVRLLLHQVPVELNGSAQQRVGVCAQPLAISRIPAWMPLTAGNTNCKAATHSVPGRTREIEAGAEAAIRRQAQRGRGSVHEMTPVPFGSFAFRVVGERDTCRLVGWER